MSGHAKFVAKKLFNRKKVKYFYTLKGVNFADLVKIERIISRAVVSLFFYVFSPGKAKNLLTFELVF